MATNVFRWLFKYHRSVHCVGYGYGLSSVTGFRLQCIFGCNFRCKFSSYSDVKNEAENFHTEEAPALKNILSRLPPSLQEIVDVLPSTDSSTIHIQLQLDRNYRDNRRRIREVLCEAFPTFQIVIKMAPALLDAHERTAKHGMQSEASEINSSTTRANPKMSSNPLRDALKNIKYVVAVHSCKGGVGKSTVAVNLAYALAQNGHAVGIFDADLYGPSLPTMISSNFDAGDGCSGVVARKNGKLKPINYRGVKAMSYGYLQQGRERQSGAILRGPMATSLLTQLLRDTAYDKLDFLVVDMPPGTGDIVISLSQLVPFSAAVVVTTPQRLAFVDVLKGLDMFQKVNIPVIAAVENMSSFVCEACSTVHRPFGRGHLTILQSQFGIEHTFEVPLYQAIAQRSDSGEPFVLDNSASTETLRDIYKRLAEAVVKETAREGALFVPQIAFDEAMQKIIFESAPGVHHVVDPYKLRLACQCAECVDELSGHSRLTLLTEEQRLLRYKHVYPVGIQRRGNYAVAIRWSDGHASSIYPYKQILHMARTDSVDAQTSNSPSHQSWFSKLFR